MPAGAGTWLLAPLAALWLAGGIVDSLIGGIGWVAQPVYNWVRSLVSGVVGWITDWLNHVIDWAASAFDAVRGGLRSLADWAYGLADWAQGAINTVVDRIVTWVGGLVQAARDVARGLFDAVVSWAQGAINRLWDYATGLVDWVKDNIWAPLWDRIEGLGSWVERTVLPWVSGLVDTLAHWAEQRVRWVTDHLCDLLGPVCPAVSTMWTLVNGAREFLVFVANHPFNWWTEAGRRIGDTAPDVIESLVARAMADQSGHIERAIVGWFDR